MYDVTAHAKLYHVGGTRDSQNAEMLIQCLIAPITRSVYIKIGFLQMDKYIIYRKDTHEALEDGGCFLKTIIDNCYSNTR